MIAPVSEIMSGLPNEENAEYQAPNRFWTRPTVGGEVDRSNPSAAIQSTKALPG